MEPQKDPLKEETPLDEKDFIQEIKGKNPLPIWGFTLIVFAIFTLLWAGGVLLFQQRQAKVQENPFLKVTNRELSLFLWQNPEFMRIHNASKTGYLPGFHSTDRVNPKLESVNDFAVAPPEVLFQYHTWKRLLGNYIFKRPISMEEFKEFLSSDPEWIPENWPEAPSEYDQFVKEMELLKVKDLQTLSLDILPLEVRQAFLGWKNYYREGDLINKPPPKTGEIQVFLKQYPNFSRPNWRNVYPEYLISIQNVSANEEESLSNEELTSFLRAAFYNFKESQKNS
jgi:hypothetical protein